MKLLVIFTLLFLQVPDNTSLQYADEIINHTLRIDGALKKGTPTFAVLLNDWEALSTDYYRLNSELPEEEATFLNKRMLDLSNIMVDIKLNSINANRRAGILMINVFIRSDCKKFKGE